MIDFMWFILSGAGALFFFFISSFITSTTIVGDGFCEYTNHTVSIKKYWMKNKTNREKEGSYEYKSDWSIRKNFAFWAVSKGSSWSFGFVATGFILQLISKLM